MDAKQLILLDLRETRRRFLKTAEGIPDVRLAWRPDAAALSIGQMIRHVLLHDRSWLLILKEGRLPTEEERELLWNSPFISVKEEADRTELHHIRFLDYVSSLDAADFATKKIRWPHKPIERLLGDALERKSYHDAVHTGQLLQYMRMLQLERPDIWD
ncbi:MULTISPECIES: DinB family protein [unclassified Paenibacillus]|uniref:DinB family protein n=1 Tax=unclassified Paenibacillus TaxID=185978 RepID=UPI000956EF7E|nr:MULTISPECIES: DinB family protein [unclassified Paenibacillus]ASS67779.1 DinB family protein [Paenibacillus sp. RUD330]SIR60928.1 Uncharacterized damage-inducible protein DinB (forms a four-helix bundle) [Paenibacillus sp. RU4X]SIR69633.1 Uncharacterized damage-inducible protein DinB (forms a four-helix bundle) [Paenibacillus sp. RU4T]